MNQIRPLTKEFQPPKLYTTPGSPQTPDVILNLVEQRVQALYQTHSTVPYHDWGHVQEVRDWVQKLVKRSSKAGMQLDVTALTIGALLHDALFFAEPSYFGCQSREELSAQYAYNMMINMGGGEEFAHKIWRIIIATHFLAEPKGPEEVVMRAADLKNVGGDYEEFKRNTARLYHESALFGPAKTGFAEFVWNAMRYLSLYAWRFLQLTPETFEGKGPVSEWHQTAITNITRLYAETQRSVGTEPTLIADITDTFTPWIPEVRGLRNNELLVGVVNDELEREKILYAAKNLLESTSVSSCVLYAPGKASATPLPSGVFDEVYLDEVEATEEALRICGPKGEVFWSSMLGVSEQISDVFKSKGHAVKKAQRENFYSFSLSL